MLAYTDNGTSMNTFNLRRLATVSAALLCIAAIASHARPALAAEATDPAVASAVPTEPAAPPAAPAPMSDETQGRIGHHHRHDNDVVSIGHNSTLAGDQQADSVVSIFGSSTSAGEAGDVVSVFGNTRVTGPVRDSAVAVLGNTYVDSRITGDVVAVLGNVELGPQADIGGDVVSVGGTLLRDPAAIVHGDVQTVMMGAVGAFDWLHIWIENCLLEGRPLALVPGIGWIWGLALAFLALYASLALLFRDGLMQCVQTLEKHPGQVVIAALLTVLSTPILIVLLCVTVIGIAAVPFVLLGMFCAGLFGKAVVLAWLGLSVTGRREAGALSHPALAVLLGGAIVLALYVVPVLGFIVYQLLGLLGIGVVVYTLVAHMRARQAGKQNGVNPPPLAASQAAAAVSAAPPPPEAPPAGASPISDPTGSTTPPPHEQPPAAAAAPTVNTAAPRAGFWIRMAALLIDALLIGVISSILFHHNDGELLLLAAYGAIMWKLRGSTIGGIVFHLHVVRLDGRQIDWATAIVRALGCFLSLVVAGLGFIWIAFDDDKQAWHDKIAGTVVVRAARSASLV